MPVQLPGAAHTQSSPILTMLTVSRLVSFAQVRLYKMPRLEHQDRKLALSRDDPTRSLIWWVASRPSRFGPVNGCPWELLSCL